MIKAVLFDFDGTLINTNDLIFSSYKIAFKSVLNRDITIEEMLKLYGRPLYPSLMEYGEAGEELYRIYREYNETNHDHLAKAFDGALAGVLELKKMGIPMGIVTSKRIHLVKRGISLMNMDGLFDVIITPDETTKTKPDPEPVLCGCEKIGFAPHEVVYVGDSVFDMESGRRAGCKICAVNYSLTPKEQLEAFSPEYFVDTILDFAKLIKEG